MTTERLEFGEMGTVPQRAKERKCAEKKKLSDAMLQAANEVLLLEAEERAHINKGNHDKLAPIVRSLLDSRAKWESGRQAYHAHIREHGG